MGAVAASDPYWNNVSFLLNYASGYGDVSTSPKALLSQGTTAARSTVGGPFTAPADTWYGVFDGTQTGVLQYDNSSSAFNFDNRSFTIDGWINPAAWAGPGLTIMSTYQMTDAYQGGWDIEVRSTIKKLRMSFDGVTTITSSHTIPLDTWSHFAVTRSGATAKMYINGSLSNTINTVPISMQGVSDTYWPNRLSVGSRIDSTSLLSNRFVGRMDELRITDSVVRNNGDFTPPTAPCPATA